MHPLAHLETQLLDYRKEKNSYYLSNIAGLMALLLVAVLIAPVLHEFSHMFFLDINHKPYVMQWDFDWARGVTGKLTPYAEMSVCDSVMLLGAGVSANFALALILFTGSFFTRKTGRLHESMISTYVAVGFIYDPMIYFFAPEGDLLNIMTLLDIQEFGLLLPLAGIVLILAVAYYVNEHATQVFREYYALLGEIERLEASLGLISAQGNPQKSRMQNILRPQPQH